MKKFLFAVTVVLAVCCSSAAVFAGEIRIGGGGAPLDNVIIPVQSHFEKNTGEKIRIVFSNAVVAVQDLMAGSVDIAIVGIGFTDLLETLKEKKIAIQPAEYQSFEVAKNKLYTIVPPSNPITKLSKEQLKGIFTGKIDNWKLVGGNDQPIILVLSNINPATMAVFKKKVLDGADFAKDVLVTGKFEDVRLSTESTPEAIAFGPYSMLTPKVKVIETPEISRPVTIITKGAPSPAIQKLISFIQGEGKKYVTE